MTSWKSTKGYKMDKDDISMGSKGQFFVTQKVTHMNIVCVDFVSEPVAVGGEWSDMTSRVICHNHTLAAKGDVDGTSRHARGGIKGPQEIAEQGVNQDRTTSVFTTCSKSQQIQFR